MDNSGVNLDWEFTYNLLAHTRRFYADELPLDRPLDQTVASLGLDMRDPRQVNDLMFSTACTADLLIDLPSTYRAIDPVECRFLSRHLAQAAASLILRLGEYVPLLVRQGHLKTEWVQLPPIDTSAYNWRAVSPNDYQIERLDQAIKLGAKNPQYVAQRDQRTALRRDLFSDRTQAFMILVACYLIFKLAAPGLRDEMGEGRAGHHANCLQLAIYDFMPASIRELR